MSTTNFPKLPKFSERTLVKSTSGKTGVILDSQGDQPFYDNKHNKWLYPWSYGLGGASEGIIPETMIKEYFNIETNQWVSYWDIPKLNLQDNKSNNDSNLKQCGECNKKTTKRYNGAAYCSDWCWSK